VRKGDSLLWREHRTFRSVACPCAGASRNSPRGRSSSARERRPCARFTEQCAGTVAFPQCSMNISQERRRKTKGQLQKPGDGLKSWGTVGGARGTVIPARGTVTRARGTVTRARGTVTRARGTVTRAQHRSTRAPRTEMRGRARGTASGAGGDHPTVRPPSPASASTSTARPRTEEGWGGRPAHPHLARGIRRQGVASAPEGERLDARAVIGGAFVDLGHFPLPGGVFVDGEGLD